MFIDRPQHHNDDERITAVKKYIHNHLQEPINRKTLAAVVGLSLPHLHRVFTTQIGENIAGYIRRLRLERAGRKLRMGAVDIGEIALAAGYETHAAFGKAFKQHFGLTPSQIRQQDCATATKLLKRGKL